MQKIMYHGTTKLRLEVGIPFEGKLTNIKEQGLRGDIPPHMKVDLEHLGYVYLCNSLDDAKFWALYQVAMDDLVPDLQKAQQMFEAVNCGSIIGIQTSNIRKNIEEDPEYYKWRIEYRKHGIPEEILNSKSGGMSGMWYRHKGNIPSKYCMGMYDLPVSKQDPLLIQTMKMQAEERYQTNTRKIIEDLCKVKMVEQQK